MFPETIRPPEKSINRIIESAVTDLPDPDSPTTATVSPLFILKDKFCTASTI